MLSVLSAHKEIHGIPKELNLFEDASITGQKVKTPCFYRLYRSLITQNVKKTAIRYCEKSPVNIRNFEIIREKHNGNFRMIQMVRDGRDVILSRHPRDKNEYWVDPERWIKDITIGLKYSSDSRILTIKYEDLVQNYDKTLKRICTFLDMDFSEELREWHKYATVRTNNALFTEIAKINDQSIRKYEKEENHERARHLTSRPAAKALLTKLGYIRND